MSNVTFIVGGCSGSATPSFARPIFGHNTTALGVIIGDRLIAIDNGSGVANVARIAARLNVTSADVVQTHHHHDHVLGLPNNTMLLRPGFVNELWYPHLEGALLKERYAQMFEESSWPVSPGTFQAHHEFHQFEPGEELLVRGLAVSTFLLLHPRGSVAYRFETPCGRVVIATDVELSEPDMRVQFAAFISDASLVYLDCQYRDAEYEGSAVICNDPAGARPRKGYGHSTPSMIKELLVHTRCLPRRLVLGHHDPCRTDKDLFMFEKEIAEALSPIAGRWIHTHFGDNPMRLHFAYECATYEVRGT